MKKIILGCAAVLLSIGLLSGCNKENNKKDNITPDPDVVEPGPVEEPDGNDGDGEDAYISVTSISVSPTSLAMYTGDTDFVVVTILPSDATNKSFTLTSSNSSVVSVTDSGVLTAKKVGNATITATSADGGKTASCSVTVLDGTDLETIETISFSSDRFEYDGLAHGISVEGEAPEGAVTSYLCLEDSSIENEAVDVGTYTIEAVTKCAGYHNLSLTAKLFIYANEDVRDLYVSGNDLYFQNARDNDYLYYYSSSDGSVTKLANDASRYFAGYSNKVYYVAKSIFSSSLNAIDTSTNDVSTTVNTKAEYLVIDTSGYAYFVVNALTNNGSGIYKYNVNNTDSNVGPELISTGKAYYLTLYNNTLFFADGTNNRHLAKINLSDTTYTREEVYEEKISSLTISEGIAYFTECHVLGDYLTKLDLSTNSAVKLTSDAGDNLTVIGNNLYYINTDWLNSRLYGDGVYYVSTETSSDSNASGTQLISGNIGSLTAYGSNLLYYDYNSNYDLNIYDLSTSNVTKNILDGFIADEIVASQLNLGGKTLEHDGKIYYLDMYRDKALSCYNPKNGYRTAITSHKVIDFSFVGDTLYYNEVTWGVNNNLYKVDVTLGNEPERVSTDDCINIVSDGTYIYYAKQSWLGSYGNTTGLYRADPDGSNESVIYTGSPTDLQYEDGYLYFTDSDALYRIKVLNTSSYTIESLYSSNSVRSIVVSEGKIYYRELYSFNALKRLVRIDTDGNNRTVLKSSSTDPIDITIHGETLYYSNDVSLSSDTYNGIWKISTSGTNDSRILANSYDGVDISPSALCYYEGYIYFLNSITTYVQNIPTSFNGNAHFYRVNVSSGTLELLS